MEPHDLPPDACRAGLFPAEIQKKQQEATK